MTRLAQEEHDHRIGGGRGGLYEALRDNPRMRERCKRRRWFLSIIRRIEREERKAS